MVAVDGHNRFEICSKNNIKFNTIQKDFESLDEVKLWMIDNQKGRRNLTDGWKFELAQKKKDILLKKGKENKGHNQYTDEESLLSTIDNKHNTRKELAKCVGWSTGKVAMAEIVWNESSEEIKETIKKGDKTINEVYNEIKKEKKKKKREEKLTKQKQELENNKGERIKDKKYDIIVIDPPWNYGRDYDPDSSRVASPYPEMTQEEIIKNIPSHNENSIMFMWTTHQFIEDALDILKEWGFEKKAILVWDKEKMGMGAWVRMQCEFCILAVKGKPCWGITDMRDIIREPRTTHSSKPEMLYEIIDKHFDKKSFLKYDFYARKKRDGWDVFGDEV